MEESSTKRCVLLLCNHVPLFLLRFLCFIATFIDETTIDMKIKESYKDEVECICIQLHKRS